MCLSISLMLVGLLESFQIEYPDPQTLIPSDSDQL